jgi:hypothetical protein
MEGDMDDAKLERALGDPRNEPSPEMRQAAKEALRRLVAGDCSHCGAAVEKRVQVGPCVYGEPCGHRLYQGRA